VSGRAWTESGWRSAPESNLTALRELALRLVARRVEGQLEGSLAGLQMPLVTDRVIVLVDGGRAATRAVRRAAALASALHAGFVAVVVQTPEMARQPFDRGRNLQEALDDAVDLGAEVVRVEAPNVVTGLEQIAPRARRDARSRATSPDAWLQAHP